MKVAQFTLFVVSLLLLWSSCNPEDENLYKKIVEQQMSFDSLRTQNYEAALEAGQNLLGLTKSFQVEFAESEYSAAIKKLEAEVFSQHRNLQEEYHRYSMLLENVLNPNNSPQVTDSLLEQIRLFGAAYPSGPAASELPDMRTLLQFQRDINTQSATKFDNLATLNAAIERAKATLTTIQTARYKQPIDHIIQTLTEQRGPLCEAETDKVLKEMKNEMINYANNELLKDSWAAKIGAGVLGKQFTPTIKNEETQYKDMDIVFERDYVYELRILFIKKQFIIPVKGVLHKNCATHIDYNIEAQKAQILQIK